MSQPIVDNLQSLESDGIVAFDALLGMEVFVIAPVICVLGDNPRHSEVMSHVGTIRKNVL